MPHIASVVSRAALVVALVSSSGVSRAQGVSLAEVLRRALARNERAQIARLAVVTADAAVRRARAAFLPSITLSASETLRPYSEDQGARVNSNAFSGALAVSQPLLSIPALPLYSGAKHSREAAQLGEVDVRRQLAFATARAFFAVIAQQRLLAAAERRLERASANLADARSRVAAQLVSVNDATRAQIERSAAAQTVAGARNALQQARISLEYLADTTLPATLGPVDGALVPADLDVDRLATRGLAQRPDLAAARASVAAADALAREPALRLVPTLGSTAQLRVADSQIAGPRYFDAALLFNLSWSIWDAGVRGADEATRQAAAATSRLQLASLQRGVRADVRAAVAALTAAQATLTAAEEGAAAARRGAEESTILYKQGLARAIELVDANLSRFNAEQSLAAAQLALRQAELDLRAALGLFPVDGVK